MRYQPLGSSGLLVSVVGLGCNNFGRRLDVDGTRAVADAAIDAGITLFDTADIYGGDGASETPALTPPPPRLRLRAEKLCHMRPKTLPVDEIDGPGGPLRG